MCIDCMNALREHFPHLTEDEHWTLLMGATAFPFVDRDTLVDQITKRAKQSAGELRIALAICDMELTEGERKYEEQKNEHSRNEGAKEVCQSP